MSVVAHLMDGRAVALAEKFETPQDVLDAALTVTDVDGLGKLEPPHALSFAGQERQRVGRGLLERTPDHIFVETATGGFVALWAVTELRLNTSASGVGFLPPHS